MALGPVEPPHAPLSDDEMERFATAIAAHLSYGRRQDDQKKQVNFWLTGAIGLISIISLIFTLGVNWGRINALETWQHQADSDLRQLQSVLADQRTQTNVIQTKLETIQRDLAELKGIMSRPAASLR
jgi:hypothetical protein